MADKARPEQARFPQSSIPWLLFGSMLAGTVCAPVLPDYLTEQTRVPSTSLGLFQTVGLLATCIFAPIAGKLADRFGNKPKLPALAALVNALLWCVYALVYSFEVALVVRVLEGITSAFLIGPGLALAGQADVERSKDVTKQGGSVLALSATLMLFGVGAGLIGGGLLGRLGTLSPFFGCGCVLILVAAGFFRLPPVAGSAPWPPPDRIAEAPRGSAPLRSLGLADTKVLLVLGFAFVDRLAAGFLMSSFLLFLRSAMQLGTTTSGIALAILTLPMAALGPYLGRRTNAKNLARSIGWGSALYGAALPLITMSGSISLWPLLVLAGVAAALMYVPTMMAAHLWAPPDLRGTVLSTAFGLGSIGYALGPVLSLWLEGVFVSAPGLPITWVALCFGGLEVSLAFLLMCQAIRPDRTATREIPSEQRPAPGNRASLGSVRASANKVENSRSTFEATGVL